MKDVIIDTNVLLVASAIHPQSPFDDCDHISNEDKLIVFEWLTAFQKDRQRTMVLDNAFKIWDEYHNKLTRGQDYGAMVVAEKLQNARFIVIDYDDHKHAQLPPGMERIDPSDRKFVAVALGDLALGNETIIVNAADSDWRECEKILLSVGITVLHLI